MQGFDAPNTSTEFTQVLHTAVAFSRRLTFGYSKWHEEIVPSLYQDLIHRVSCPLAKPTQPGATRTG